MLPPIPKTTGIKDFLKNHKKLIAELNATDEPLLLLNHNEPEGVFITVKQYEIFREDLEDYEDIRRIEAKIEKQKNKKGKPIGQISKELS